MKIKITDVGALQILRAGEWKAQICPFMGLNESCGDWCPHFQELTDFDGSQMFVYGVVLCMGTRLCGHQEDFSDERKYPKIPA